MNTSPNMDDNCCSICLDEQTDESLSFILDCQCDNKCSKHKFHKNCIRKWVVEHGHDECPVCRAPINMDKMISLHKNELDFIGRLICLSVKGKDRIQAFQEVTRKAMAVAVQFSPPIETNEDTYATLENILQQDEEHVPPEEERFFMRNLLPPSRIRPPPVLNDGGRLQMRPMGSIPALRLLTLSRILSNNSRYNYVN